MPPQRKGAIERGKRSESSRCRNERVKRRYRFLFQSRAPPFHRHGTDTMPDTPPPFVIPAKGKEERIILRPPTAKIYPARKTLHLNSPLLRSGSHAGYYSESRHFCAVVGRTDGIYHGGDLPEGSGDRQEAELPFLGPCYHHSIRRQGSHLGHPSFAIFSFSTIPSQPPLSSSLISDNSSKRVSEPGTKKDRVMMKTTGGRRSVQLRESERAEWSGDFNLDAQNGK